MSELRQLQTLDPLPKADIEVEFDVRAQADLKTAHDPIYPCAVSAIAEA